MNVLEFINSLSLSADREAVKADNEDLIQFEAEAALAALDEVDGVEVSIEVATKLGAFSEEASSYVSEKQNGDD